MRFHSANWAGFRTLAAFAFMLAPALVAAGCGEEPEGPAITPSGSGAAASGGMGAVASGGNDGSGGIVSPSTGGSTSNLTLLGPVERDGKLVLEFGETYVEIDPELGGRVTSLRQGTTELFIDDDVNGNNWGSTYWTSPQSDWDWPPITAIDSEPYTATVDGASVTLVSAEADVGPVVGGKNVTVTKRFAANLVSEAIDIEYTLTNVGGAAISLASWEISRVAGGGLTFYPTGASELTPVDPPHPGVVPVTHAANVTWFDHATFPLGTNAKLNADGTGGWLAHVADGVLLLKTFQDVPQASQAPGEGEVEIFADMSGGYVEVENQGPYVTIQPGASSTYKVTWLVRKLPSDVQVAVGSASLLSFVQSLR